MDKKLHIVSFDVTWPANYGGVIDVYYKVKALHSAGVKVVLHCFEYGDRERNAETEKYCEQVYYYKRITGIQGLSLLRPYIVNSRKNPMLLKNLQLDSAPILFEGLHTCFYLNHPLLEGRKKYVRTHNIEHDYYKGLEKTEEKWYKRLYYKIEASYLKRYEVILKDANALFAISENDEVYFSAINRTTLLTPFHGNDTVHSLLGEGEYCLYHANLSVAENEYAAISLIENVFSHIDVPIIIAGANPSSYLKEVIDKYENLKLISNPSDNNMIQLKKDAHVHVLYSAQATGTKLKLLDSLSLGRFVVANDNILVNETLKSAAVEANNWQEYISNIEDLFTRVFLQDDIKQRVSVVQTAYSNKKNVQKIIEVIYN